MITLGTGTGAEGTVKNQLVNKAKFNLVLPDEIQKYNKSNNQ